MLDRLTAPLVFTALAAGLIAVFVGVNTPQPAPALAPPAAQTFPALVTEHLIVTGADVRIVDRSGPEWIVGWRAEVSNPLFRPVHCIVVADLIDAAGFPVPIESLDASTSGIIGAGQKALFTSTANLSPELAARVARVEIRLGASVR